MLLIRHIPYAFWKEAALEGRLKISCASEFNDPFDCFGRGYGLIPYSVLDEWAKKSPKEFMNTEIGIEMLIDGKLDRNAEIQRRQNKFASTFNRLSTTRESLDKALRIMCFSDPKEIIDKYADILMWSHYADKGKGVRIWIDIDTDKKLGWEVSPVSYSDEVPQCDLSMITEMPVCDYLNDYFERVVYTKGLAWKYEAEHRLITSPRLRPPCLHLRENDKQVDKLILSLEMIKRIDFGPAVGSEFVVDMHDVQKKRSGMPLEFYRTVKMGSVYRYKYIKL